MISSGNVIVSEMDETLLSLRSASVHVIGVIDMQLVYVNISFQSVVNEHLNALRKYQSDVEQAFGRDIRLKSPNASEADINAALGNAVGYARDSNIPHSVIVVETGDSSTNSIGKELLPKYLDLVPLVDSIGVMLQSIALYNTNAELDRVAMDTVRVHLDEDQLNRIRGHICRLQSYLCCGIVLIILFVIVAPVMGALYPSRGGSD